MITRRHLLATAAAVALSTSLPAAAQSPKPKYKLIAFSKPFQSLSPAQTADLVAAVGWDGIECPVRAKGQIEPDRVEDDLPRLVVALKKQNLEIPIITTDVKEVTPLNEKVLRTAAALGIRKYRLMHYRYAKDKPLQSQLDEIRAKYRDLAALNKSLNIQAGYQNHSGPDYVGSAIWDIVSVLKDFDPNQIALHFDIGHATLEGGLSWPTQARLAQPLLGAVYIKDFFWDKTPTGFRNRWCPLGQGMVQKSFLDNLRKSTFPGPICQHHEYFPPNTTPDQMIPAFKKDLETLRTWLA